MATISNHWLQRHKEGWQRLENLLTDISRRSIRGLSRTELRELGLLYRQAAADLSRLREDPASQAFAGYLNQLLGRAHNTIYAGKKSSPAEILRFYYLEYPAIFRRMFRYSALATALFLAGAVAGAILTIVSPAFERSFLGPAMVETIERREMWTHSVVSIMPLASSSIMTNNMSVAFTTFAAGITGGLGTLYELVFNGLMLGVIGVACWMSGMSLQLWSFVAPHGVLELPAIMIAGGAGLRLAQSLLFPGTLSRRDSLAEGGTEAVQLLVGTIPILIVAGTIEGFFSPSGVPPTLKFVVAVCMFTLLAAYLKRNQR